MNDSVFVEFYVVIFKIAGDEVKDKSPSSAHSDMGESLLMKNFDLESPGEIYIYLSI